MISQIPRTASHCFRWTLALVLLCGAMASPLAHAAGIPTINNLLPESGPVGSTVEIRGTNFVPPLSITFGGNVQAEGSFTSTSITVTVPSGAIDGPIQVSTAEGTAVSARSFTVGGKETPLATLEATVPQVKLGSGDAGKFAVKLSEARDSGTVVKFKLGGSAKNGTDYKLLVDTVKVAAGKEMKIIKVVPKGNLGGAALKTVKLTLIPGAGYKVGDPAAAEVKIIAGK
jgi:hypothetical protein